MPKDLSKAFKSLLKAFKKPSRFPEGPFKGLQMLSQHLEGFSKALKGPPALVLEGLLKVH